MAFDLDLRDNGASTFDLALSGSTSTTATPTEASGTGTAYDTTSLVVPVATEATGTSAANDAPASVRSPATEATGTGAANGTTTAILGGVTEATGTGAAGDPTVITGILVPATEATGSGASNDAAPLVGTVGSTATGTGTGADTTSLVAPGAAEASGTGTAYDATVQTVIGTAAGIADGTGTAGSATASVAGNAAGATGTGAANDPSVSIVNSTTALADIATGSGAALQPVAGGSGVIPGASTTAQTANNQANTNLSITLPTANVDDTICIDILIQNPSIDTDPGFNLPAGWTQIGYALDTTGGAGMSPYGTSIYRRKQAGDPSSLNITWTASGQAVAVATAYQYVNIVTPINAQAVQGKGTTTTAYTVDVTTTDTTLIRSWFGNRSGHTFSALADTVRGSALNTSASSIVAQDTNGMVSAGTYTKTATGSGSTQAGIEVAYGLAYGLPITNVTATPTVASGTGSVTAAGVLDDRVGGGATGNNAAPSVTLSSQIKIGQVVLVHITLNNSDNIVSTPADLTQIDSVAVGTTSSADHIYYLVADAITPGRTLTWGLSATRNWAITYLALSNIDQQVEATINAVESVGDNVAATTSFTTPSMTSSADSYIVEVFSAKGDGVGITDLGMPAGYTPRAEANNGGTFGMSSGIADRTANPSSPGTYGGNTWTTNQPSVSTIRHVIAFRVADSAQAAPGAGEAGDAYPTVTVYPAEAAGTGSAPFDPNGVTTSTTLIGDNPIYGIGTAYDPIVQTGQFATTEPVEGAGIGSAYNPLVRVSAAPGAATGTGAPEDSLYAVTVGQAAPASGVGTAPDGTISTSQIVVLGDNIGTGTAYDAAISTANQAIGAPADANAFGAAYNATVFTVTTNDIVVSAGSAQGFGFAYTVYGYDVGVLLRIKPTSLPGFIPERYLLSRRKNFHGAGVLYTEIALFIADDGTVSVVEVDAPITDGDFIRNPSALKMEPGSFEANALIAAGYELEPVS